MENDITYNDPDLAPNQRRAPLSPACEAAKIPLYPLYLAIDGIKFDFNYGLRIFVPGNGKTYRISFYDLISGTVIYDGTVSLNIYMTDNKKYYIKYRLHIHLQGNPQNSFLYSMDLKDKLVMLHFSSNALGDVISWFSCVLQFKNKYKCKVICAGPNSLAILFKQQYPDITFINKLLSVNYRPYASYYMVINFDNDKGKQPVDFRYTSLQQLAGNILGVDRVLLDPPRVDLSLKRQIALKYVVIATQSTAQAKYWNNPVGWDTVIRFLKSNGYKVFCIDKLRCFGNGLVWNKIPWGVLDLTGDKSLQLRINLIKDADFFIGLSSGLSWLAWCCKVPVVLISGFSLPLVLFYTPYRVINYHVCNGCWNDVGCKFDHGDFLWCPRHKNTSRQFLCTKCIYPQQVINTIKTIPQFKEG